MVVLMVFLLCTTILHAKDYGVHGHTFEITEPDLLKQITGKLNQLDAAGELNAHNEVLKARAQKSIQRPAPVSNITKATTSRIFTYDPAITVPYDLKDHKGQVFHKAGTRVNPLSFREMTKSLVFIDGDDAKQAAWAMKNFTELNAKIILTSGSPFELMETHDRPIYFDQEGRITGKLGIKHVPAVVSQEGLLLKIEEKVL